MQKLANDQLVDDFDYNAISFGEPCVQGKHHRSPFPTDGSEQSKELLELVHSDVCGKLNVLSLSGAKYFLTFIDDKTRHFEVEGPGFEMEGFGGEIDGSKTENPAYG